MSVEITRATVERMIQNLRRYLDVEESDKAPESGINISSSYIRKSGSPITGCAIKPLIGPASHTRDVTCSESPRPSKNGVP